MHLQVNNGLYSHRSTGTAAQALQHYFFHWVFILMLNHIGTASWPLLVHYLTVMQPYHMCMPGNPVGSPSLDFCMTLPDVHTTALDFLLLQSVTWDWEKSEPISLPSLYLPPTCKSCWWEKLSAIDILSATVSRRAVERPETLNVGSSAFTMPEKVMVEAAPSQVAGAWWTLGEE